MIKWGSTISGQSNRSRKAHARRVQTSNSEVNIFHFISSKLQRSGLTDLTFTDEDLNGLEFPHDDPLVITSLISNHNVHRILVNIRATSNITAHLKQWVLQRVT